MKKKNQIIKQNSFTEFLLYTTPNGKVKVEILLRNENIWLTQTKIAELFGVQRPAITKHLKNIFETKELDEKSVSFILEHTASDGKTYKTKFYNIVMYMRDWVNKLDAFLQFNERDILQDNGEISHEVTVALAESEYEKYKKIQDKNYNSDFDQEIKKLLKKTKK